MKKILGIIFCMVIIAFAGAGSIEYSLENAMGIKNLTGSKMDIYWYTNSGNKEISIQPNVTMSLTHFRDVNLNSIDTCFMIINVGGKKVEVKSFRGRLEFAKRIISIVEGSDKKVIHDQLVRDRQYQDLLKVYKDAVGVGGKRIYIK